MIITKWKHFPALRRCSRFFSGAMEDNRIRIRNSILSTGELDLINPHDEISWYCCGPTVYDVSHLGHARTYVSIDIVRRILEDYFGVNINFALGITDIDDKIINKGKAMNFTSWDDMSQIARDFEVEFFKDMQRLNVKRPSAILRVSEHIPEIVNYVEKIRQNGYCYESEDGVYFDVLSFGESKYGKLGQLPNVDEADEDRSFSKIKRNPRDFALWKSAKPDEPSWNSPWGKGRPGWHIECSAMTHSYFGSNVDIHSGGIDLKFPHHTNEIAQCEAFNNQEGWVRYWLHTGHLFIKGLKMSKSLKNFISIQDYFASGVTSHPAFDFRLYCLQNKYHSSLQYGSDRIVEASQYRQRLENFWYTANNIEKEITRLLANGRPLSSSSNTNDNSCSKSSTLSWMWSCKPTEESQKLVIKLKSTRKEVHEALQHDFDTPRALQSLMDLISDCQIYGNTILLSLAQQQHLNHPIEILISAKDYIWRIFDIFGLDLLAVGLTPSSSVFQQPSHCISVSGTKFDEDIFMEGLLSYRSEVRKTTLDLLKKTKQWEKLKDGNEDDIQAIQRDIKDLSLSLMKTNDFVRDELAKKLGYRIEDMGNTSTYKPFHEHDK